MSETNKSTDRKRTAVIAGATGLVGSHCLDELLSSNRYEKVIALGRRKLSRENDKLLSLVVDFDQLDKVEGLADFDDVFCCLGTTIKKAGSKANFKKVDYTYVINLANLAKKVGATRFMVVSAVGANAKSGVFYNQVKGEMENSLKELKIPETHIFEPSLLLGDREEFRLGERIGEFVMKLARHVLRGGLSKYRAIDASDVAKSMVRFAESTSRQNVLVHQYADMKP